MWKMKPNKHRKLIVSPSQGVEVVQGEIKTQEVFITIEKDCGLMPTTKVSPF